MPSISIIIPVFNSEKYINKCVDSVLSQTVKDIEIILVDDGSTDGSPAICDKYDLVDPRISVIHKANGGAGSARNAGLDMARGDYILFVDGDDYIHPQMVELLLLVINRYDCKIASCHYQFVKPDEPISFHTYNNSIIESAERIDCAEMLSAFDQHCRRVSLISPCMRLCHKSVFEELRFKEGYIEEDSIILPYVLERAESIYKLNIPLYFWTENPDSVTRNGFSAKRLAFMMVSYERILFFQNKNDKRLKRVFQKEFMNRCVEYYLKALSTDNTKSLLKAYKPYRGLYLHHWAEYYFTSGFCKLEYMMHLFFLLKIPVYKALYKRLYP